MNHKRNGDLLTLFPQGRIDSSNAPQTEAEVYRLLQETQPRSLIIDAEQLSYISSAGLRIVLRLRKDFSDLRVINAASDVYSIFDMTGFTEMMPVTKALRRLSVEGCEVIDEGAHGAVYRIDPDTIVKVYKDNVTPDDIHRERELARKAFIMGVPTAIPYDVVRVGDRYGSVFELLNAKSFAQLIREGEPVGELARQSVDILKTIHRLTVDDGSLPRKKPEADSWAHRSAKYLPAAVGDRIIRLFEAIPETDNMLHGDFHIKNIMRQKGENLLIDMDTLSTGHPIYELAAIFAAYEGFSCGGTDSCVKFLGITRENCRDFLDATFDAYFSDRTKGEIDEIRRKAAFISYTRIFRRAVERYGDDPAHRDEIAFCRSYLIDHVDRIDTLYY